ncbi:MAG: DUF3276 family protein [Porphyromonadaceae bacterium]|nr:DUF3276 family protein [Porphyromonadaceae bacterium]
MKEKEYSASKELFSKCVKAGSRFYYLDAKQDQQGNNYLVISESRINARTGQRERQRIFVYEEDINKFVQGLGEVISTFGAISSRETEQERAVMLNHTEGMDGAITPVDIPDVDQFLQEEME